MSRSTAVVVGAGIAALASARVLAGRFERVVVLERDPLPATAEPRPGVPQGVHPHTLLAAGQLALEDLFDGLEKELISDGASLFESGTNLVFHRFGQLWPLVSTGVRMLTVTRPLLELTIRRRVAELPTVEVRGASVVSGLTGDDRRITGAVLSTGETVHADLVVDCTGRGARSDRWLAAFGYPAPDVSEVKIGVGYASRILRRRPGDLETGAAMYIMATPPAERRIGVALPIEGDRWLVGLGGWHGESPGADPDSFAAFARSLPHPGIIDLLDKAEPVTDVAVQQFPSSRRRHFERLRRVPAGFVALGDAIASFNPIYGQGMTAAVLQAQALGDAVDRHGCSSEVMPGAFYRAAAGIVSTPWRFAVGADFMYPETTGPRPVAVNLLNRYSIRVQRAAMRSTDVRRSFVAVQHLLAPSSRLVHPATVVKVLRASRAMASR